MSSKPILTFALFVFLPYLTFSELLFEPPTAGIYEPRIGSSFQLDSKELRLDIGTSVDLKRLDFDEDGKLSVGADFFTYSRLRRESNFKFPVETADYYFGANAAYVGKLGGSRIQSRLRIAHISSHLVDGYSEDSEFWFEPFVYSREFVDFLAAITVLDGFENRVYLGGTYIFSTAPDDFDPVVPQAGFDFEYPIWKSINIAAGYDFRLVGAAGRSIGTSALEGGILWRTSDFAGIAFNVNYYSGASMHGMFYKCRDSFTSVGFRILFY